MMAFPGGAFGTRILTSEFLERKLKPYPRRLKAYKQRTLKRWARDPRHWTQAQILTLRGGAEIWCAPSLLARVREAVGGLYT